MLKYLTRDNIVLILSIIGSLGTIAGWIYTYFNNRKKFSVKSNGYTANPNGLIIHCQICNNSRLPIAINEVAVKIEGAEYVCTPIPKKVLESTHRIGKTITDHEAYYSVDFPINLAPLCGCSGYLYFSSDKAPFPPVSKTVNLVIRTNRGKELEMQLPLGAPLYQ